MGKSWRQAIDGRHSESLACMGILYESETRLGAQVGTSRDTHPPKPFWQWMARVGPQGNGIGW